MNEEYDKLKEKFEKEKKEWEKELHEMLFGSDLPKYSSNNPYPPCLTIKCKKDCCEKKPPKGIHITCDSKNRFTLTTADDQSVEIVYSAENGFCISGFKGDSLTVVDCEGNGKKWGK